MPFTGVEEDDWVFQGLNIEGTGERLHYYRTVIMPGAIPRLPKVLLSSIPQLQRIASLPDVGWG